MTATAPASRPAPGDRAYDVVVAGGGLVGLGVAWRAAQAGLAVAVVDDAPGTGASHAAAGMLAPASEAGYGEGRLLALARASLRRYPDFVAELEAATGLPVGLRTSGTLLVAVDADDARVLAEQHAFQRELGLEVERLLPSAARRLEPSLAPRLRAALHVPGDASVDPRALHAALLAACTRAGVALVRRRAAALLVEGGRARGLRLADAGQPDSGSADGAGAGAGELRGDAVVLALGAWSAQLPGVPAASVPVRPVKGQILRLRARTPLLNGTVRAQVHGREVYLVPYGETSVVVGASVEERGFDATVTAGAVHDLLHDAIEVVPEVAELELAETTVRWRPGSPDNAPLLGATALDGLVLACGHHRNGVLLTPVTADAVAAVLTGGTLPEEAAGARADRFPTTSQREGDPAWT